MNCMVGSACVAMCLSALLMLRNKWIHTLFSVQTLRVRLVLSSVQLLLSRHVS
jgi:hypothetical protein